MVHRRMLAPIVSKKHYVQTGLTNIAVAAILNIEIADSVLAPAAALNEVVEGSVVKAVFIEIWALGNSAAGNFGAFNMTIEKRGQGSPAMTNTQSLNLGSYPNKKNILYTTQGVLSTGSVSAAIPLIRQWFAIPKGKQRMGIGDKIVLNLSNISAIGYDVCGIYTYKEYT